MSAGHSAFITGTVLVSCSLATMTYDVDAQKLAVKVIGTVESNLTYDALNYNDPITVGVVQWYGTRAAAVLDRMRDENPSSWTGVAGTLDSALTAHPADDAAYWTTRYLTRTEGESLRPVLRANRVIQNTQIVDDLDGYKTVAVNNGMDPDTNTATMIFFFTMWHQSPRSALQVLGSAGPSATLDRMYAVCLNHPVLGQYRPRYTDARTLILAGDSTGIDIDPTPGPDPAPGGDNGTGTTRTPGDIARVSMVGDRLVIEYADAHRLQCVPNGRGYWLPVLDTAVGADVPPPPDTTPTDPPPEGTTVQDALVQWMVDRIGRYAYSQGPSRLSPETNMYTDCSALVHTCFMDVMGKEIGTWTGNQWNQGTYVTDGYGSIDTSLLQKGDLLFFTWPGGSVANYDHVEMFKGGTDIIGHGGPMAGPIVKDLAMNVAGAYHTMVRRHT